MISKFKVFGAAIMAALVSLIMAGADAAPPANPKTWRCGETPLAKSECMINAALEDLRATYRHPGGAGITEIKRLSTNEYRFSMAQEERVDHVTYQFGWTKNGRLRLDRRTEGVVSMPGR